MSDVNPWEFEVQEFRFGTIPTGTYRVRLIDLQLTASDRFKRELIRWIFEVVEGDLAGTQVSGITSMRISERSKAYRWFTALGGQPKEKDGKKVIDLQDVVGNEALARIETRRDANGREWSNVVDLYPLVEEKKKTVEDIVREVFKEYKTVKLEVIIKRVAEELGVDEDVAEVLVDKLISKGVIKETTRGNYKLAKQ